jgi:hypothetical protein
MISSRLGGTSPPQERCTDAGDAEADSMIGRFGRIAQGLGRALSGLLVVALLLGMPQISRAKPALQITGPSMEGDPTADDQPSPSPKGNKSAKIVTPSQSRSVDSLRLRARELNARLAVEIYMRLLLSIR